MSDQPDFQTLIEQIYFEVNYAFAFTFGLALLVWLADDLRTARPATRPSPASLTG